MTDPYQILGVSRDASDDEIKKAYRDLARKYHPDNYVNSPLADLATEKMKEINTAYAEIQQERAAGQRTSSGSQSSSHTNSGRTYTGEYADNFRRIREAINAGQYSDAVYMLNAIPPAFHNAEWNFLQGIVLMQKGFFYDAEKCFSNACFMDPSNEEYRMAYQNIHNRATNFNRGFTGHTSSMSGCDICSTLICADCCCEMCGGDLISCC